MSSAPRTIEFVFFAGCPHADRARENLRTALVRRGITPEWKEWDLEMPDLPDGLRGYPSPTVLVEGRDVTGEGSGGHEVEAGGVACRADGAPSIEVILAALESG